MVGLAVAERHIRPLGAGLDAVVRKASESYPVDEHAELHGHALVQARDDWKRMGNKGANMVRARIGVYADALRAIAAHDVGVVVRGLDLRTRPDRVPTGESPHQIVLRHLLENIDRCSARQRELALVIADEVDGAEGHREHFRTYQQVGTGGRLSSTLSHIVDTIHFAPSKSSRLLQAADLIAYLHRRLMSGQDGDSRARRANETLWSHIEPRVLHRRCVDA